MVSHYKRRRVHTDVYSPATMLLHLVQLKLSAVIQHASIWIAVEPQVAEHLDRCCTGQVDGGPQTATDVAAVLELATIPAAHAAAPVEGEADATAAELQQPAAAGARLVAVRLSLEEAFFMQYVLGALNVFRASLDGTAPQLLSEQDLWAACCSARSNFVESYVGYHHLKAKGWLPRSGLLYGVDYVVYQMHPAVMHSDYGVLLMPFKGPHRPELDWHDVQITARLIGQVAKKLVLLYIHERECGPDHSTPACLASFTVEERLVQRWSPDTTRE